MRRGRATASPAGARGMTLVELLVGLALGLLVVAAATGVLVDRLREHRRQLVEGRLLHDLRHASLLITRDLRRAGHWGDAAAALSPPSPVAAANPYAALSTDPAGASFRYSRDPVENHVVDSHEEFGVRLRDGVLEMSLGAGGWQALTDKATLRVLSFAITPEVQQVSLAGTCTVPCPAGLAGCPPVQELRSLSVAITGRASADAQVVRSAHATVRLRNDVVVGRCPA